MDRKNSAARITANNKYNSKAYDKITVSVPKGTKEAIKARSDESLNGYINRLISEDLSENTK